MTVLVKIKNKKARRIPENLAFLNIIEIAEESKEVFPRKKTKLQFKNVNSFCQ